MERKHNGRRAGSGAAFSKAALALVFFGLVLVPLAGMLKKLTWENLRQVFTSGGFGAAALHSLTATGVATAITLVMAYLLAYCMERTAMPGKGLFAVILALPMLIPSISHGMGLVLLLGNNGILTRLLGLNTSIYGLWGIVAGSVLYAFPVAFLMLDDVMKYEDCTPYEAARVMNIPAWRRFTGITLPYLRKPLISVVFATFTMIVTDYGVPLMVGGKYGTVPVLLYQEVIGRLDFGRGSVYGAVLLIPAVAAFLFDALNRDKGNGGYVTAPFLPERRPLLDGLAAGWCGLVSLLTLLPIGAFILLAFAKKYPADLSFTLENLLHTLRLGGGKYLGNSVVIALGTAAAGVSVAFAAAYLTARMPGRFGKALHLMAIVSAAVPGVVLGLSYALTYRGGGIYGTLLILVMVNTAHFIASPYLMLYNSLHKLNENLEAVGETLGISRPRMIRDVFIPQCGGTILEAFAYFFVNCMMTISAVSFLANTATKPVSLMINQFEAQMQLECAAVVSLAILLINLFMKALIRLVRKKLGNA